MMKLAGLTKSFGRVEALRGITLEVPHGSVGLLGPNGAGKSTLIRTLLGLVAPTAGTAEVLGFDCVDRALDIRARVGYLPEDDCHIPGLSAVEYVTYAAELSGLPPSDAIQRAHEVLDYVGMVEERYRGVETYSTGMRQRIKLAQALVHDPEVLFLDEPTNGMDPAGRRDMLALIRDVATSGGMSVLVSSHLLPDVEEVCEHIVVLASGMVRLNGKLSDLVTQGGNRFDVRLKGDTSGFIDAVAQLGGSLAPADGNLVRVTLPEGAGARTLVEIAHRTNVQVRHLRPARMTLEAVFMQALGEAPPAEETVHAHS